MEVRDHFELDGVRTRLAALRDVRIGRFLGSDIAFWVGNAVLALLLVTPIWTLNYLPLGDLPDHAGQLRMILDFEPYQDQFRINWFTPYLLSYLLTLPLAALVSIAFAIKAVLTLSLIAIPAACYWLIRTGGGARYWVWLTFPIAYSFSFYWGFYSYVVATPVALGTWAFYMWYGKQHRTLRLDALACFISLVLFFSHAMAWAMAAPLCFLSLWETRDFKRTLSRFTPFLLVLPVVAVWMSSGGEGGGPEYRLDHAINQAKNTGIYIWEQFQRQGAEDKHLVRVRELLSFSVGKPAVIDYAALAVLLCLAPWWLGGKLTGSWQRYVAVALVVAAFIVVPYWIFDTAYVYYRFAVFLIPAALLLYQRNPDPPATLPGRYVMIYGVVLLTLLGINRQFQQFSQDDQDFSGLIEHVAPNSKTLTLVFDNNSAFRYSSAYLHFGGWIQAERGGEVLMNFPRDPDAKNVPVRYIGDPLPVPSVWDPHTFNWDKHRGDYYDYFLVRAAPEKRVVLDRYARRNRVSLVEQRGMWRLYKAGSDVDQQP